MYKNTSMCLRLYPDDKEESCIGKGDFRKVVVLFERGRRVVGSSGKCQWSFALI